MQNTINTIRKFVTFDTVLVLVLGISVGLYMKSIASQNITIGHSDPAIYNDGKTYDIDVLEQELISQGIPVEADVNSTEGSIDAEGPATTERLVQ